MKFSNQNNYKTPLYYAIELNKLEIVQAFLDNDGIYSINDYSVSTSSFIQLFLSFL